MNKMTISIARVCHEANRAWCIVSGEDANTIFQEWDACPPEIRNSAISGVEKALEGATPEQLHESWSEQKVKDGWVYGTIKDLKAKTHPCLVTYSQLPEAQRRKDALFQAVVNALK